MQRRGRVLIGERAASAMEDPKIEAIAPAMAALTTARRDALRPTSLVSSSKRRSSTEGGSSILRTPPKDSTGPGRSRVDALRCAYVRQTREEWHTCAERQTTRFQVERQAVRTRAGRGAPQPPVVVHGTTCHADLDGRRSAWCGCR